MSSACNFCYAEGWAKRTGHPELWTGERRRTSAAYWRQPLKWDRQAAAAGVRRRVFCASLADVFDNQVPKGWRDDLWSLIRATPHLTWMLLTKRPQNIQGMLPGGFCSDTWGSGWPTVWLGATAENQEEWDRRLPHLALIPAAVHFVSVEPMLGPIDCGNALGSAIDWVICGGESGSHARPMHPDWARSLRDQCVHAGVPFHFKQWGEWLDADSETFQSLSVQDSRFEAMAEYQEPWFGCYRVGKKRAGRLLDGREWNEVPNA